MPKTVANAFFEDSLEVGIPIVRAKASTTEYGKSTISKNQITTNLVVRECPKTICKATASTSTSDLFTKKRKSNFPIKSQFEKC